MWRCLAILVCFSLILVTVTARAEIFATAVVVCAEGASSTAKLAAKEVRRYVYLRTGKLLPMAPAADGQAAIVLKIDTALEPQQYGLKTSRNVLTISGGSDAGVLYGAYDLAGKLGVRFYVHGDVVPDAKIPFAIPQLNETHAPLFKTRGIQPFHDFPEGPDWWNQDDYLAYVSQLAKMRMNFLGLHTYPQGNVGPEPLVWIGLPQDVNLDGTVKSSYWSYWHNTARAGLWGYASMKTSEFTDGAAQLFAEDDHGPDAMKGLMPRPATPEQCNELFNRVGKQMGAVFVAARKVGVKTCIGTETPLTIPDALRAHLKQLGKDPNDPKVIRELYDGMFKRIVAVMPADYYWLWTPEDWTWGGNNAKQFEHTKRDLLTAYGSLKDLGSPMRLATCGWVLGPQHDRAALDAALPKDVVMGCINRMTGNESDEYAFADLHGRSKWCIPWMENDPGLISYQPWAARMRYDAVDAKRLGCDGLLGIHWRTKILAMNIAALADAAWDQSWVPAGHDISPIKPCSGSKNPAPESRAMPIRDFYVDFARAHFGDTVAVEAGELLATYDGKSRDNGGNVNAVSNWVNGPGNLLADPNLAARLAERFAFIAKFAELRPKISGVGNLERFEYWLNTLRVADAQCQLATLRGQINDLMDRVQHEKNSVKKAQSARDALKVRIALTRKWDEMMTAQVAAADTPGELGTIANLEQHNRKQEGYLSGHDAALEIALGQKLPAECTPAMTYTGPARLIVPTVRGSVQKGEELMLKIIAMDRQPVKSVSVRLRPLGGGEWRNLPATHVARAVHQVKLPAASDDFEYNIVAERSDGSKLVWPITAPEINQTIVVEP